jgi:hypothetical protein
MNDLFITWLKEYYDLLDKAPYWKNNELLKYLIQNNCGRGFIGYACEKQDGYNQYQRESVYHLYYYFAGLHAQECNAFQHYHNPHFDDDLTCRVINEFNFIESLIWFIEKDKK